MSGRGPGPRDRDLFAAHHIASLRSAVADLSWLLTRGYAGRSALKLVGDRYSLTERQRVAVSRSACSDAQRDGRRGRRATELHGASVAVDGFNALIVTESALGGGLVLVGRDGAHRDLASVHGSWRRVEHTDAAIEAMAAALAAAREVKVLLDKPVSNSGRLAKRIRALAAANAWPWEVELVTSADRKLMESRSIVATGDARILDACTAWYDVPGAVIAAHGDAWVIDLST